MTTTIDPRQLVAQPQRPTIADSGLQPGVGTSSLSWEMRALWATLATGTIVAAALIANKVFDDAGFVPGTGNKPVDGMTIFAVFFVGATAIERLLEPLSSAILPQETKKQVAGAKKDAAQDVTHELALQIMAFPADPATETRARARASLDEAAEAAQDVADRDWYRTVAFWALASVVAIVASASLDLYFLGTVGIASPSRWEEILATGLILGAGTKPLHDLIELLSAKKDAAKA
ncbi:hypothetical protein [Nocardioides rubriscoriae]|uniref:hypothetical protein n=1 Tax=Nocardioides rubriscoriae TaxID=642762 RepID=UPI0011DFE4D7|nr:hypothetical protein [Nocardioides rubriscoriae]